jgi:hypothetical protein
MDSEPFILSDSERRNPLWLKLREHFAQMLANKRGNNDDPNLTEIKTAKIRGEINLLKAIIALGDEPPIDG